MLIVEFIRHAIQIKGKFVALYVKFQFQKKNSIINVEKSIALYISSNKTELLKLMEFVQYGICDIIYCTNMLFI